VLSDRDIPTCRDHRLKAQITCARRNRDGCTTPSLFRPCEEQSFFHPCRGVHYDRTRRPASAEQSRGAPAAWHLQSSIPCRCAALLRTLLFHDIRRNRTV